MSSRAKERRIREVEARVFNKDGAPKYVRCYDNGGSTIDRYTIVFTGRYRHTTGGVFWNYGLSANPRHPQGVGSCGESYEQIDRPSYSHLGKPIAWAELPEAVRNFIMGEYRSLWLDEYPSQPYPANLDQLMYLLERDKE